MPAKVRARTLQASVGRSKVKVHDSAVRRRLKYDFLGKATRRKPLPSAKTNMAASEQTARRVEQRSQTEQQMDWFLFI